MSVASEIIELLSGLGVDVFDGYPGTGAQLPYVVVRHMILDQENTSINGLAIDWDNQVNSYCAAAGVTAANNLATDVMRTLQGKYVLGSTLSPSMAYMGVQVEGHYESLVTSQINQGGI